MAGSQVSLGRAIISDDDGPAGKYLLIQILHFQKMSEGSPTSVTSLWRENSKFQVLKPFSNFCFDFLFSRGRTSNPGRSREVTNYPKKFEEKMALI